MITTFLLVIIMHSNILDSNISQPVKCEDSLIYWSSNYHLKWSDFKFCDTCSLSSMECMAYSSVGIKYYCYADEDDIRFAVFNYFNRKKSVTRTRSSSLLQHEQLHFDIDQLYVRKIKKKIAELKQKKITDLKCYDSSIEELIKENQNFQKKYDMETAHGLIIKIQNEWNLKIRQNLILLNKHEKNDAIDIPVDERNIRSER